MSQRTVKSVLFKGKRFRNNNDKTLSGTIVELTTFKRIPVTTTNAALNNNGQEPEKSEVSTDSKLLKGKKF